MHESTSPGKIELRALPVTIEIALSQPVLVARRTDAQFDAEFRSIADRLGDEMAAQSRKRQDVRERFPKRTDGLDDDHVDLLIWLVGL